LKLIDHLRNALAKRGRGESYELSGSARSGADTARLTISPLFILAGTVHLARPDVFASIMPEAVPHPHAVIIGTGIAEVVGAAGLFVPRVQALAGVMLALYAICVYPANIAMPSMICRPAPVLVGPIIIPDCSCSH
jgi:uncharacterized membrane protein